MTLARKRSLAKCKANPDYALLLADSNLEMARILADEGIIYLDKYGRTPTQQEHMRKLRDDAEYRKEWSASCKKQRIVINRAKAKDQRKFLEDWKIKQIIEKRYKN